MKILIYALIVLIVVLVLFFIVKNYNKKREETELKKDEKTAEKISLDLMEKIRKVKDYFQNREGEIVDDFDDPNYNEGEIIDSGLNPNFENEINWA